MLYGRKKYLTYSLRLSVWPAVFKLITSIGIGTSENI